MKVIMVFFVTLAFFGLAGQAFAVGYDIHIESSNNVYENTGKITGFQTVAGGVATQKVGLRVVAPTADWGYKYIGSGNRYVNTGEIIGVQTVGAGVAIQAVGLEVN